MPSLGHAVAHGLGIVGRDLDAALDFATDEVAEPLSLAKRVFIPVNETSSPGLIAASEQDPWQEAGKYALGWTYFCIILLVLTAVASFFNYWRDKMRTAWYKDEQLASMSSSPATDYEMKALDTSKTSAGLFPRPGDVPKPPKAESTLSTIGPLNKTIAAVRWLLYRPVPNLRWRKHVFVFPSVGSMMVAFGALVFVTLYAFLPRPLYHESIRYGSPPLAIRAGMLAVAVMPWIMATSMKANAVSFVTGIGHERLNKFHRWAGHLILFLSLVHAVPFYVQPAGEKGAMEVFKSYFAEETLVYTTGIACLVTLIWLCVASLPFLRSWMYELFIALHVPAAIAFTGLLFWHCQNYLTSWHYLWATVAIWLSSYIFRIFKLNWANPWRASWLVGDEAAITLLPENAIRITIPTQVRWKPGQFVYLRIPAISIFENHPFTVASLCSDDFPSEFGEQYRDMALVFNPYGGFTRKVLDTALERGPEQTYRAFVDGPYGGMRRSLDSFDNVVLIGGGSGITALVSHVLDLVKRMRDGKAVTKKVQVVWAVRRLEAMEWFNEELRICREHAPLDSVECQFFVTSAKRQSGSAPPKAQRPISGLFGSEKINDFAQGIASKRSSAIVRDAADGNVDRERELRRENEDDIAALPSTQHIKPPKPAHTRQKPSLELGLGVELGSGGNGGGGGVPIWPPQANFDFGFPSTPTLFQKNLMRFAFGVSGVKQRNGWNVEYGRPDIPYMLKDFASDFGKRSCVFVCGPPSMRTDVARTVAGLQREVLHNPLRDEIYLHYEDFAL